MIPLIASVLHALLFDANAVRRWIRGGVGVLAVSGAAYADQVGALLHAPGVASWMRAAAVLAAFAVAAHDAQRKKKIAAVLEPPK